MRAAFRLARDGFLLRLFDSRPGFRAVRIFMDARLGRKARVLPGPVIFLPRHLAFGMGVLEILRIPIPSIRPAPR